MRMLVPTLAIIALFGCATTTQAQDKAAQTQQAIEKAETEFAAAKKAGHVWQLIDKATGKKSAHLGKLLDAAKEKQGAGEYEEAMRIANRVAEAAVPGQQQASSQSNVSPFYND